eukprot:CAMPEP_0113299390 /NCGR_PEP_ID=MMETSP0010_2-20120614/1448_1 /TAXON_ID=216773 ORGANISM="Corethron hystrix, Strain 308" /NCGR_SAMPLE_ID=MMETSP0010_2 /ASSEMBLY_ACC=CAM_ASM_000155 /LENGTH=356 /DNA_ID=CAMNT_0000152623 /DNA_START=319 /DNA_END=1389 /DNA_ORIENTATION=+ /assembly_acc=CAM_ASM_000155
MSLAAMCAGVTTVGATCAGIEQLTSPECPEFDARGTRFDQGTFMGRFAERLLACDPTLLVYSSAKVEQAKAMVDNAPYLISNPPSGSSNVHRELWESKRIVDATLHPDTGIAIPAPFRMSGYVPFNGPVCVAMVASSSTPALLFWNWANQSQNALVNYFNRNASSDVTNEEIIKSYTIAVGAAMSVAFGLATFIKRSYDPATAQRMLRFVAFPASVAASSLNCYIVRSPEISTGVSLFDKDGKTVLEGDTSQVAAKKGVYATTASRALLPAPVYFLPPALMAAVSPIRRLTEKNPRLSVPITTFLLMISFGIGLPATIAVFPQISEIEVDKLEEKYQNLKDDQGKPIQRLYFNKGL